MVGGTYTWFLCPSPSDDSSIGGKASRLEGCEGVCALFGLSVRGCGVSLPLCSRVAYWGRRNFFLSRPYNSLSGTVRTCGACGVFCEGL